MLVLTLDAVISPELNKVVLRTGGKLLIPTPVNPAPLPVNVPLKLPDADDVENELINPTAELIAEVLRFVKVSCPESLVTTNQDCDEPLTPPATKPIDPRAVLIPALKVDATD